MIPSIGFFTIRSGEAEFSSHHRVAAEMAPSLCYFMSRKRSSSWVHIPAQTENVLLRRLDPNAGESHRVSVEALVYTAARTCLLTLVKQSADRTYKFIPVIKRNQVLF